MSRIHRAACAHPLRQVFRSLLHCTRSSRRASIRQNVPAYTNVPSEALEERMLLAGVNDDPSNPAWAVAVDADAQQDVQSLIDALGTVATAADGGAAKDSLSTLNTNVKTLLDVGGTSIIQSSLNLTQPVSDLFAANSNATVHDLAVAIDDAVKPFGGHVDVDLDAIGTGTANDLQLQILVSHSVDGSTDIGFDQSQIPSGGDSLKLDGSAAVDLHTSLEADVSLTVDLDATGRDEGVLKLDQLRVATSFIDAAVDGEATYHFAKLTSEGTSNGAASVDVSLTDPTPATAGLTVSELSNVSSHISEIKAASLSISLPVTTDLTGFNGTTSPEPTISLADSDLFDADVQLSGTLDDFGSLDPFTQMSAAQFQAALESVTNVFEEVDKSSLLSAEIVLTNGQTLQQLVDVSDVFTTEVLSGLIDPGTLELAVSNDVAAWTAIEDGSFGLSVDGESVKLTGLDFSAATDMNVVASALQNAINDYTQTAADVTVAFDSSVSRTDNDGNTTTVAALTISSSGITSAAAVTSPGVIEDDGAAVGTALLGGVIVEGGDVAVAATPKYGNAQEFRDLIQTLTNNAVEDVLFVAATDGNPAGLQFAFNVTQDFDQVSRDLNLNLPTDVLTNLRTEAQVELTADIATSATIEVGLTPISGTFELQPGTTLAELNAGHGVMLNRDTGGNPNADGNDDISVTLKDGTSFNVNFDNATTVEDILAAFNDKAGSKATLSIAADKLRFLIEDHTTGDTLLSVAAVNGSLSGFSLGLTGTASAEDDTNTAGNEATTISGAALHGLTIADHVQLSNVSIAPKVHLEAQRIDATGRLGAISIELDKEGDDSAVEGEFSQQVTFGTEGHSAADLVHSISGDSSPAISTVESHVDLHWGIDVDGSLRDRVAHDNSRADGTVIVSAGTELGAYQTGGPQVALTISDARELQEVAAVDLQDLSNLLDDAARIIGDLGVLQKKLPLIKRSVSQLVNVEKELLKLTPKLKPHLSGPLQNVEGIIADALKLNSTEASPIQPKVTLSLDRSEVQEGSTSKVGDVALRLDIDVSFSAANLDSARDLDADPFTPGLQVPIDFDVKELGLDLPNLIDSSGEALITVDAGATLRLSVGLQLTGDNKGQTFIYDKTKNGTRLTTDLTANAEQISFNASVGPFGASIDGGTLAITGSDPFSADFNLQNIDPATYGVHIIGGGDDGRVTIAEARQDNNAIAENGVTAYAFADLPTFFPTAANPLGSFGLKSDLPLYNEYLDSDTGFESTDTDDGGVAVKKGDEQVYTARTPSFDLNKLDLGANMLALVGGWEGVFDVIIDAMRGEVLGVDIPLIGDALGSQAYYLEQIRDNVSDSFVTGDDGNPTLDMITSVFFSALGPDGANFLKDGNGDNEVTIDDVVVTTEVGPFGALHDVKFELPMGVSTVLDDKIAFDLGLPGIGLEVDGGVQLQADFDFDLAIGINTDDGVYVDTSAENEIQLVVTATLPDFAAKGKVGFLQVDVTDHADTPTHATASFAIDLKDLNDGDDNDNLTFSEFRSARSDQIIGATLNTDVDISLDLVSSFNGSANFPRVRTDFGVDWSYTRGLGAAANETTDIGVPTVAFNDVGLNLGEFITNFVKPLAEQVKEVTDPVQPILDAIHSRVPVVSDIIGNVTWLDLAAMFGGADVEPYIDAIATVQDFIDLTNSLSSISNDTWIEAGSFALDGNGALNGTPGNVDTESHTEPAKTVDEQLADHGADGLTEPKKEKVIKIPLLKKPANALGLLTGKNVDLVLFDLPALELDFNMARRVPFPPFPALYAELGGGVSSKIDFNFGYDTSGLRQFVSTLNPADIANGLFISDRENLDGTGKDVPEATFTGYLYVQGGLDAGIFEAGVRGQISSTVNFDLHDYPDEFTNETDGRIRVDEIWRSLQLSPPPLHVFDVSGSVDAGLSAFWKIDLLFSTIRRSYNIASTRLLDFRLSRPAESRDKIATKSGDTLTLEPTDGNDHFVVLPGNDPNDPNRVVVRTLDESGDILETKGFAGITRIVANGRAGNDTIRIDETLTQLVELFGGEGNDTLIAGAGPATLHGGGGNDELHGTAHADTLTGGAGDDKLYGYAGDDDLSGDDGNDELVGDLGNDSLRGGRGNDTLHGDEGRDILHGDEGEDQLYGGEGDDRLFGHANNDRLFGENGRDYLDGGTSDDELFGGALSDTLIGGDGNDTIDGGGSNDTIYGNRAGNVTVGPNLKDDIGSGDNTIIGGAGSDLISTGSGNDQIFTGVRQNNVAATADNLRNVVHSTGGDNTIFGDMGVDLIVTAAGIDTINAGDGADVIVSGSGNDMVLGEGGDDVVVGGFGIDNIQSGRGNDIVWGGLLPATLSGIDPTSTTSTDRLPQTIAALNGSLARRVLDWALDTVRPTGWEDAEAANPTSFAVPTIMPRGMNGLSIEGTSYDGDDIIDGGADNDVLFGGSDHDTIRGGGGSDFIDGGAGNDRAFGGDGNDVVLGGANNDSVFGNAGVDQLYGGFGDDTLFAGAGIPDATTGVQNLAGQRSWGGDGVDKLYAYAAIDNSETAAELRAEAAHSGDEMHGGNGGDFLYGNLRADALYGNNGNDTLLGDWLAGPGTGEDGLPGENTHKATVGGNDLLVGGSGEDNLSGGGGNDTLYGGADSDRLEGHDGLDTLNGGSWIDLLVLDVDPNYTDSGPPDALDGHGPAAPGVFTDDDNATDILIIEGDHDKTVEVTGEVLGADDHIRLGQNGAGQLVVLYNDRVIEATWLDGFGKPLVEQFQVDGLTGDDTLAFIDAPETVTGNDGNPLQVRPLDFSGLANRTDFVGVLNGGPGDDHLTGTPVRDRLDGSSGSDVLFGYAGDDRLYGGHAGSANDHDEMFAGQGNDDVFGGSGSNELFAWTRNPFEGEQFGLFVDDNGELVTDNGDLNGDGLLDSDTSSRPYQPEDTGLNRMLGNVYEDDIYGGTGLDFIFGNGGHDRNFRADGTQFEAGDGNLGGDTWVEYARNNTGVWYIGGSIREDQISLDYVTEEGVLSGRHVVTRSTTIIDHLGVPRTTFSVSADLDFGATDSSGNLIWNPAGHTWNSETNTFHDDTVTLNQILPPEASHQSIIIDALGGDDTVIVGETVQGTVWISAGDGNDFVQIESGNALLPDRTDTNHRNDSLSTAFELTRPELPAVLTGGTLPQDGQLSADARFTLKINDNAPVEVVIPKAAVDGHDGSFRNENADDLLFDINAALDNAGLISQVSATLDNGVLHFISTARGDDAKLLLKADSGNPTIFELGFTNGEEVAGTSTTSIYQYNDLTIDGVNDEDFYRFTLHEPTGPSALARLNSATSDDGLVTTLYRSREVGDPELIAVNRDAWDREGSANETPATARELQDVESLSGIGGLTLHSPTDVDQFKFTLDQAGVHTDKVVIRRTAGDASLQLNLSDSNGTEVVTATVKDGEPNVHEFLLEDVAAGTYTIRITSDSAARYELIPSIGLVGSRVINLNSGESSAVSLAGLDTGVYFLQVSSPNQLPTVYNLEFDLDLAEAIEAQAIGLAGTSFHVSRRDVITGGAGHDVLIGGLGEDWIFGGEGNDVISGGLDAQASDLLFGGGGSDTFQLLPDQLPTLHGSTDTFVPTYNDQLDGGEGEDRVLYLGGDYTTHPATGQQVAIPDVVTLRFNTQLHRYEFTSLRYDIANDRFETTADGSEYVQQYQFFQAINIEDTVIDVQAGDDMVRADAEFKFPGNDSEWGIKVGNLEQGATLGALTIEGGEGNDTLFGGDLNDLIDGGEGDDIIVGGLGDDLLFGGGGSDKIGGQHAGDQTPAFTADDITFSTLAAPTVLAAGAHEPVYRTLPFAEPELLADPHQPATVQSTDVTLDDADALHGIDGESVQRTADVGDVNADGFDDFVVTTNRNHYLFFGPVDLSTLGEIDARTDVDARNIAGRADVVIDLSLGTVLNDRANINGDVNAQQQPIHDLVFTSHNSTATTINVLYGGAGLRDGQATAAWPRTIASPESVDASNWFHFVPSGGPGDVSLLDYDGDGSSDFLLTSTTNRPVDARLYTAANLHNGTGVSPTFYLPTRVGDQRLSASIQAAGDLNGDEREDLIGVLHAGSPDDNRAYVLYSRIDTPPTVDLSASYDRTFTDSRLGGSLTRVGDINGDGFDDLSLRHTDGSVIIYGESERVLDLEAARSAGTNVELDPSVLHGLQETTIELDFRTPSAGDDVQTLLSSLDSDSNNEFSVFLHPDRRVEVVDKGLSSFWNLPSAAADGEWHHLTIIRRPSEVTMYIGERVALTKVTDWSTTPLDQPVAGVKRVRIQLHGQNYLSLAEVVIRDADGNNVALNGTARQSSTRVGSGGNVASVAIDGNSNGQWNGGSVTHTHKDKHAWWEVELAAATEIHEIEIFNRTDCCGDRLSNFQVQAFDENDTQVWIREFAHLNESSLLALQTEDVSQPISGGKTVRLELEGTEYLTIAEVVVRDADGNNVALNGTATQSSDQRNASRAIDGNTNGRWSANSVSSTGKEESPFWQLELAAATDIHQIDIFNRTDAAPERFSNMRISVLDDAGNEIWSKRVGHFDSRRLEAFSLRKSISVSGEIGVVRTLEVNAPAGNASSLYVLNGTGQRINLAAVPGTLNRYRPTSALPANTQPNGFWKLFDSTSELEDWSLRLETTGETYTKRWTTYRNVNRSVNLGLFRYRWTERVATGHSQANTIDENALKFISTPIEVAGRVDEFGQKELVNGIDFTLGLIDFSGERNFRSTLVSPSGLEVDLGTRTSGFLSEFNGEDPEGTWTLAIETGTDRTAFKPQLTGWELDLFTSGSELIFDGKSQGTQLTPSRTPSSFSADPVQPRRTTGRYVRIEATEAGQTLNLANVSVLDLHNRHIAVLGTATQSGNNANAAALAIDTGSTHDATTAIAQADSSGRAWWQLDLGKDFDISDVHFTFDDYEAASGHQVITSVVRDNGTVDFRDRLAIQQDGIRERTYNGLKQYANTALHSPNADVIDSTIGYPSRRGVFGITWDGEIEIPTTGDVTFWINSDDGGRVFINDQLVADNGGVWNRRDSNGTISLTPGHHRIRVEHYNIGGPGNLKLEYQLPGGSRQEIPASVLSASVLNSLFDSSRPTQTLSVDIPRVVGDVSFIEVLTSHNGSDISAHLIAPDGTEFVANAVAGSTARFSPANVPQLSQTSGTWTVVLEGQTDFDFTEFDLILHTVDGSKHYRRHGFARQQPHAGIANDTFEPIANAVGATGPIARSLGQWPVTDDPFTLNLERFGVTPEQLIASELTEENDGPAGAEPEPIELLTTLHEEGITHSLELEQLSVEALTLGRDRDNLGGRFQEWQDSHGQIDNVRVWDKALDGHEALALSDRAYTNFDRTHLHAELDFDHANDTIRTEANVLDFADDVAFLDHSALDGLEEFTFETRIRTEALIDRGSSLISAATASGQNEFLAYLLPSRSMMIFLKEQRVQIALDTALDDGKWHDLSIVRSNVDGGSQIRIYVDGKAQAQPANFPGGALTIPEGGLVLGQDQDVLGGGFDSNQAFHGQLGNLRIWSEALSTEQITAGLGGGLTDAQDENLMAYHRFDRFGRSELRDESRYGRDGRLGTGDMQPRQVSVQTPLPTNAGNALPALQRDALRFDDDIVELDHTILDGRNEFTVEIQVRAEEPAQNRLYSILSAAKSASGNNEFLVVLKRDEIHIYDNGPAHVFSVPGIRNGEWHDVAIVRQVVDGRPRLDLYVDGTYHGRKTPANSPINVARGGLIIGQDQDSVGGGFDSNQADYGELKNLRVWSVPRTADQIASGLNGRVLNPKSEDHLEVWLPLDNPRVIQDESQHKRNGTIRGAAPTYANPISNTVAELRVTSTQTLEQLNTQTLSLPEGYRAMTEFVADVNGNGFSDVALWAFDLSNGGRSLFVAKDVGAATGDDATFTQLLTADRAESAHLINTIDVNGDGIDDFVLMRNFNGEPTLPVVWGEYEQAIVPKNFDVAANRSVTGSGDFVVDKGTAETFSFEFTEDEITDGRGEKWVRFTTLGDGNHDGNTWLDLSPFVRADLVRDDGSVLAKNFWTLDLSDLPAGTYYLKVTSFAVESSPKFNLAMRVPLAGQARTSTDFDQIFGGEGQDWISGGQFRDVIFANDSDDASDTVIGEPIEFRDIDVFTVPERTFNGQTIPSYDIQLENIIAPAASETNNVVPNAGQRIHLIRPERETRLISGQVFNDLNQDGIRQSDETASNGMLIQLRNAKGDFIADAWTSNIDWNNDGVIDPTTETGWYSFIAEQSVEYQVQKGEQAGWILTTPQTQRGITAETSSPTAFGVFELPPATIVGVLFNDLNSNGTFDGTDSPLADWTISLYDDRGNRVAQAVTDSGGAYEFAGLVQGKYRVEREHRDGWGPDSGELGDLQELFTHRLGLFLSDVDFDSWTPDVSIRSQRRLWYAFTEDGRLLQGRTAEDAQSGTLVRDLSDILTSPHTLAEDLQRIQQIFAARAIPVDAVSGATTNTTLRAHEILPGALAGNIYHDFDGNAVHDNGETGVDGLTVKLFDDNHDLIKTTTTDVAGNYNFEDLHVGIYFVSVVAPGWDSTYGKEDEILHRAHELDTQLGLHYTGQYFEDWGGLREKWLYGEGGKWYFIRVSGNVYEWNGSSRNDLSGSLVGTLSPRFHDNPELLFEAEMPDSVAAVVHEGTTTAVQSIGVVQTATATVQGVAFLDNNGNGERDADDFSINGVVISVTGGPADSYDVTFTETVDLNGDGNTELLTENGVYILENLVPGVYHARIIEVESVEGDGNDEAKFRITAPANQPSEYFLAQDLNAELKLEPTDFRSRNAGSRGELWLQGDGDDTEYYYLLATGELIRWNGNHYGPLRGETVATLTPEYYHDLSLLHEAPPPGTVSFRVDDAEMTSGPAFGIEKLDERMLDEILSYWHVIDE